jgi:hypothetical protein
MINKIKHWWNCEDKFDTFFFMWVFFIVVLSCYMIYDITEETKQYVAECDAKGGVAVAGKRNILTCISKDVIL